MVHFQTLNNDNDSLKNFNECVRRKSESSALDKINDLINLAENKLENIISSTMIRGEMNCVYLNEPAYFDDDFDQKSYIEKLVRAKLYGLTIIKESKKPKFLKKYMHKHIESSRESKLHLDVLRDSTLPESKELFENGKEILMNEIENDRYVNSNKVVEKMQVLKNTKIIKVNASLDKLPGKNMKSVLKIQSLPSISIRSELIEQKFPLVDIYPSDKNNCSSEKNNIAIVHSKYGEDCQNIDDEMVDDKINEIGEETNSFLTQGRENDSTKRIKFVKLPNDFDESNMSKNTNDIIIENKPSERFLNNDNSYIFINKTFNRDIPILPKNKKISTLKKYGIPEIKRIYNPKQLIHKKVDHLDLKFNSNRNIPYFTNSSFPKSYMSQQSVSKSSYSKRPNTNYQTKKSFEKTSYSNFEYIPYSQLTIGGIENKVSKISNHNVDIDKSDDLKIESESENNTSTPIATSNNESRVEVQSQNDKFNTYSIDSNSSIQNMNESDSEKIIEAKKLLNKVKSVKGSKKNNTLINKEKKKTKNAVNDHNKATQTDTKYTGNISMDIRNIEDVKGVEEEICDRASSSNTHLTENAEDLHMNKNNFKILALPKETQTIVMNTVDAMTSPKREIPRIELIGEKNTSRSSEEKQVLINVEKGIQTDKRQKSTTQSENSFYDTDNEQKRFSKSIKSRRVAKNLMNVSSASDGYVDESKSESSDIQSLGEINLTIFRKKLIRILDEAYSHNSNSSFSTTFNSNIHLNSTLSSKKSDGEISLHINSDKII